MKTCKVCGKTEPEAEFIRPGFKCRACNIEYLRQYRVEHKATLNAKQRAKWDARDETAKAKELARGRMRHYKNHAKQIARSKDYYRRHRETVLARQARNPHPDPAKKMRDWRAKNPDKNKAAKAAYYSRMRRATPWADKALISDIYKYARIMRQHGVDCHVDHEVPLRGKMVSGLHTHENLTVILAEQNVRKNAKFEVT